MDILTFRKIAFFPYTDIILSVYKKISIHGYFFVRVWRNRVFTDISIVRQFAKFLYTDNLF